MPKVREVLKHVRVETAERRRKCHRKEEHSIEKGTTCLAIYDPATSGRKNYCPDCAKPILQRARTDLRELEAGLGWSGS